MYYEEKVINGVLCYRTTPNGEFVEKTKEQLTDLVHDLYSRLNEMESRKVFYQQAPYYLNPDFKMPPVTS